jgi:hypothetical protein
LVSSRHPWGVAAVDRAAMSRALVRLGAHPTATHKGRPTLSLEGSP